MISERMLRETAIGQTQPRDPTLEQLAAFIGPLLPAISRIALAVPGQPRTTHEETSSFTRSVVVVLRNGVKRSEVNTSAMRLHESHQPGYNIPFQTCQAQCQQRVNQPDGDFLSAHPVRAGVGGIAQPPVLHPELQCREITCIPAYPPSAGKDRCPNESGHFPDDFDVPRIGAKLRNFAPMQRGMWVSLVLEWVQEPIRRISDALAMYGKEIS